ncbi:MAG TPA: two-component regulator propeller domain-containing protein [Bacteroidia bacterium]|nr:two-component regulator propeller domain-containing protein [Bacteroidia bacterium]
MNKQFHLLILFLTLTISFSARSQSSLSEKSLSIENDFSVEVFNTESGFPQNSVIDILQSSNGYLWFSTFSGIVRYDGLKFTVFSNNETKGLLSNTVLSIKEDKYKNLWFLDDAGHLVKYDGNIFTGFEKSFGNIKISDFCFSEDGTLYVSTTNNEIYTVNGNILDFGTRINQYKILLITAGKNNSLLIATTGGLFELKNGNIQQIESIPKTQVLSLCYDRDNFLWVGTTAGIYKVSAAKTEIVNLPDESEGYSKIFVDRQNRKWIFDGYDGIYLLGTNDFNQISEESGLSSNNIKVVYQDSEDNIWVGTSNAGVNKLTYKIFRTFSVEDGLIADGVAPIVKSANGAVYVGNNCGGINKIIDGKIIKIPEPKENTCIWSMLEDKDENLWVGTYGGGLFKFKNDKEVFHFNKSNGLADDVVFALYQDSKGIIWIGTDKSIFTIQHDTISHFAKGVIKTKVTYFTEDSVGNIWAASNNGLYKITNTQKIDLFTTYHGLPSNSIRSLYFDEEKTLWIGTVRGGFSRLKAGKFVSFTNIPELSTLDVFCIVEDNEQNLWFTTNKGIYNVKKYDLNNYADQKSATLSFNYYDRKDGLKTSEFNSGFQPNYLKEDPTHFWFPTIKGVAILNTRRIIKSDYIPQIIFENIIADGKEILPLGNINLHQKVKTLEINYTAPKFNNPQKIFFQYKLDGVDGDWQTATTERTVRYFNLNPGNYTFKIRLYGIFGTEKSLSFYVPMPFYKSNIFLVILYVTGIAFLGLIAYFRIKHIRNQEKKKTALNKRFAEFELKALQAQMNPHFLFNCLNTIKFFITTNNHSAANKYLTKFSKLLRMFLDHSTSESITIEEEINMLRLYIELEHMRFDEGFNFHLQVDESIDYKNTEIPATILQPFVENAINHGLVNLNRQGNLTLIFEQKNGCIVGIIDDDGIGRAEAARLKNHSTSQHISRGTQLIDDRIKTLNSIREQHIEIQIIDKEDDQHNATGTRVIVTIPI